MKKCYSCSLMTYKEDMHTITWWDFTGRVIHSECGLPFMEKEVQWESKVCTECFKEVYESENNHFI